MVDARQDDGAFMRVGELEMPIEGGAERIVEYARSLCHVVDTMRSKGIEEKDLDLVVPWLLLGALQDRRTPYGLRVRACGVQLGRHGLRQGFVSQRNLSYIPLDRCTEMAYMVNLSCWQTVTATLSLLPWRTDARALPFPAFQRGYMVIHSRTRQKLL